MCFRDEAGGFNFLEPFFRRLAFAVEIKSCGVVGGDHAGFKKAAQKVKIAVLK